jgi:hypothetical protein
MKTKFILSLFFSTLANAQITNIPPEAITTSTNRALDRWKSCGGRFEKFANEIGNKTIKNYIAMPSFVLSNSITRLSKSKIYINNMTTELDVALEQEFSKWLGDKFKKVKNSGTQYTKDVEFWYAKFDPMGLPCETIVYDLQALGPPIKTAAVYSKKYNLKLLTNGYGYTNEDIAKTRREYIQNRVMNMRYMGYDEYRIQEFETRALEMTQTPEYLQNLADESVDALKDLWRSCGGKYATFVDTKLNVGSIKSITIMPGYFKEKQYYGDMLLAGVSYTDQGILKVISYFFGAERRADNSVSYFSYHSKFIMKWEIGHTFYHQFGYRDGAGNVATEGGSKRPCDFLGSL